jgi:hypothetical protein
MTGNLYFNPIQKYRNDGTVFRGDKYEGMIPIDPQKISIRNADGKEWFTDLGLPRPSRITQVLKDDHQTFIFCVAVISMDILKEKERGSNTYVFNEAFKNTMRDFGDYALIFCSEELIERLENARKTHVPEFVSMSGPIIYRDLNDFSDAGSFHTAYRVSKSKYDPYFVKDNKYKNQNEWRLLIDGATQQLEPNCGEGFSLFIGELEWAYLHETSIFLDTFQYCGDDEEQA